MIAGSASAGGSARYAPSLALRAITVGFAVVLLAGCGKDPDRIYDFRGQVVSIDPSGRTVVIDHEDIPGLMRAMKMPFAVEDPVLVDGLVPGITVEGKLKVVSGKFVLLELKRKSVPIGPEREIQENLSRLVPEDRKLVEQQGICPISDEGLGTKGLPVKLRLKNETVFLCCDKCRPKAEQDPDATLKKVDELRKR